MSLKAHLELLEIIERQNELVAKLISENFEQENIINALMQEQSEDVSQLSE